MFSAEIPNVVATVVFAELNAVSGFILESLAIFFCVTDVAKVVRALRFVSSLVITSRSPISQDYCGYAEGD